MKQKQIDQLFTLLSKPSKLDYLQDESENELVLTISGCSQSDLEFMQQLIEQARAGATTVDYGAYFQAVLSHPMYKPANPGLAILHVAKTYHLDVHELTEVFKARPR